MAQRQNKNKVAKRSVKSFIFSAETEAEEIIRIIIIKKERNNEVKNKMKKRVRNSLSATNV